MAFRFAHEADPDARLYLNDSLTETEMDVAIVMPADAAKLADQAVIYGEVVRACIHTRRCRGITTWGFTDRYSWIPSFLPGFGAALPFDESLQPKPAYHAIVAALA